MNIKQKGFTLVEALISITILALMGLLMVSLLNQSFNLNTKSQIVSKIKQNGQTALNAIQNAVQTADSIECPQPSFSPDPSVLVVEKNGIYTRFSIHPEDPFVNGYIGMESFGGPDTNSQNYCLTNPAPPGILVNPTSYLTDRDLVNGVSVKTSPGFTSTATNNVTVQFDMGPAKNAPSAVANQVTSVSFRTTFNVRQR